MRNRELVWGTLLSYAQQALSVFLGLVYTPFLLRKLGQNEYGLYSTVASTVSMLSMLSLGLSNGYIRYYSRYKKDNDRPAIDRLNGLYLLIFSALGTLVLLIGFYLSNHLQLVFEKGLTPEEYVTARKLAIILTINLAVSFPASLLGAIVTAHERFIFQRTVSFVTALISPAATVILLMMGYRSIALVCVSFVLSLLRDLILCFFVFHTLKERFCFTQLEKAVFKGLVIYTIPIALNSVIDQINWNIDKILLGRFKGTAEVAVYNVGYSLYAMYMSVSTAISGVFTPRVHGIVNAYTENKTQLRQSLTDLFIKVGRIQYEILLLVLTGMLFFGRPFIVNLWAGRGYENSYPVLLLLAIPSIIPFIQNLGIEIQRAENRHQFRSIVYSVMALVNLFLSIYLGRRYGAIGCTIGTAIALVLCNGFIMNIYYHKKCYIDVISFWKSILRVSVGVVPPIAIWLLIRRHFVLTNISGFIAGVVVYTALYGISMWFLGINSEEKQLVKELLSSLTKKLKV